MNERPNLHVDDGGTGPAAARPVLRSYDVAVKSATRALEIIELFAVHRHPLSVSEIAGALDIPQSSSSVLLQALSGAGFITRDRQTRKYLPSIRSVFLGNWIHDALFRGGSLLGTLDALARNANANVRIGVRNGLNVQYVHVSWPGAGPDADRLGPGTKLPACHDALGRMLLAVEEETVARGIVRHANAIGDPRDWVDVEALMRELRKHRAEGHAQSADLTDRRETVLAVPLPAQFGVPAAIGVGVPVGRLDAERDTLLHMLDTVVASRWGRAHDANPDHGCDIAAARTSLD